MSIGVENESLAEMTIKEYILSLTRILEDELKLLNGMFTSWAATSSKADDLNKAYERIRSIKGDGENVKVMIMEYLVKNSEVLMYSGRYMEIVRSLDRIIQHTDGLAYRFLLLIENNIRVEPSIIKTLVEMNEQSIKQLKKLMEAINILSVNPKRSLDHINEVINAEDIVDSMYRKLVFEIYQKLAGYVPALMVLKDIAEFQEEICDLLKDIGEELRYLALVRSVGK